MSQLTIGRISRRVFLVAASFNRRFTTEEFVARFRGRFPLSWRYLVRRYAPGGKGAGRPYSAATRVAMMLKHFAHQGYISRQKYVPASPAWGSPVVRTWRS